jgi:pimeloyl-ACP methyl ester carboxylesterase
MVLVGFSMGAPVVIEAANRLPGQVDGVVIVDHLQDIEMRMPPEVMNSVEKLFMDLVSNPTNEKLMQGGFYKKNPEMTYKRVLAMLKGTSKTGWQEALRNTMKWQNDSCISSLRQLSAPVIAINSDRMPTNVAAFKNHVPSYQARIIPDTGHLVMWDAPDEFNRQLEASITEFMQN